MLLKVELLDVLFQCPGITKLVFRAEYNDYKRRGVIWYDINKKQFLTHTYDIELLAKLCLCLQQPCYI